MSAHTRGLVIGVGDTQLVIEANKEEIRRYAVRQAVDVLARDGWEMQPVRPRGQFTVDDVQPGFRPDKVLAVLRTRCHCEREMEVDFPPPMEIRVPVCSMATMMSGPDWDVNVQSSIRIFRRSREYVQRQHVGDVHVGHGPSFPLGYGAGTQSRRWLLYEEQ